MVLARHTMTIEVGLLVCTPSIEANINHSLDMVCCIHITIIPPAVRELPVGEAK
jgi:hypothetical protein